MLRRDFFKGTLAIMAAPLPSLLPERGLYMREPMGSPTAPTTSSNDFEASRIKDRLAWADEQMKTLKIDRVDYEAGGGFGCEIQFTHPENGKRYGFRFSVADRYNGRQILRSFKKMDASIRKTLAFPEKAWAGAAPRTEGG